MKRCKRRRNEGLNTTTHVILRRKLEDSKSLHEDPKDPLYGIATYSLWTSEGTLYYLARPYKFSFRVREISRVFRRTSVTGVSDVT